MDRFRGGHDDIYTGLNLDGRRWSRPSNGKWLSQDPSDFSSRDTDLSPIVANDPTDAIDPSGLAGMTARQLYFYYWQNPYEMGPVMGLVQRPAVYVAVTASVGAMAVAVAQIAATMTAVNAI